MSRIASVVLACLLAVCSAFMLMACGGGSSSSSAPVTLSGTAAAGSPIIGWVHVTGANGGTASSQIAANGTYSVNTSGLTPPFIIYAEGNAGGKSVKLYSTAASAGAVNITPVTDFIVRNVTMGMDPEAALLNWPTVSAMVNTTAISTAQDVVRTQLGPILTAAGLPPTVNLMSMSFKADHTGMDLVLDVLDVSVSGATVTVTNKLTGETFSDNLSDNTDPTGLITAPTSAFTDATAIAAIWGSLTGIAAPTTPDPVAIASWIAANVADDFMDEGEDKAMLLNAWTVQGEGPAGGMKLSASLVEAIAPPAGYTKAYRVRLRVVFGTYSDEMETVMAYNGTKWLWRGDHRWVGLHEAPVSIMTMAIAANGSVTNTTGFQFYVGDRGGYAFANGVNSIVVNGPGIASGVVLAHSAQQQSYVYQNFTTLQLSDGQVAAIGDNALYTVSLCSEAAATLEALQVPYAGCTVVSGQQYTKINAKPPVAPSDLTAAIFPAFAAGTSHSIADYTPATGVPVSWTNPTNGTRVYRASAGFSDGVGGWIDGGSDNLDAVTSTTLDTTGINFTPTNGTLYLQADDIFGRSVKVQWAIQ